MKPKTIQSKEAYELNAQLHEKLKEAEAICLKLRACFPEPDTSNVHASEWKMFDYATNVLFLIE